MRHTKQLLQMISGLVKHPHGLYVIYTNLHIYLRIEIVRFSDGRLIDFTIYLPDDQIEHSTTNELLDMCSAEFNKFIMDSYCMRAEVVIH